MRVAFASEVTPHHRETEAGQRMRRLARSLAERGHDVCFFCARWWDGELDEFEHEDVTYRAVTPSVENAPSLAYSLQLPRAIYGFDPDVVHATYPPGRHVLGADTAAKFSRASLVLEWYGADVPFEYDPHTNGLRGHGRHIAANTPDAIVTPTRTVKTEVREAGGRNGSIRIVPNSIDVETIQATPAADVADIVYSRRLDEDANVQSLLLALAELRDRGWTATVVGDGPERDQYERQARDLRIDDRVTFVGERSLEERIAAFKGARVYVQTAYRESFPTDLLRALACGCVGVVEYHARSSAHELVENVERGFRTTTEQELVDAIRTAGELPEMEFNEEFAPFDHSAVLERYLDCYREIGRSSGLLSAAKRQ